MSHYGICAKINGVPCGLILRDPTRNGRYQAVFEREFASLEEICLLYTSDAADE